VVTGSDQAFTIRPEKIHIGEPDDDPGPDRPSALGHVREVVYLGALTRYIVSLDAGGELVVVQQNLERSSMEALQVRGRAVRLWWDRQHTRPVEEAGDEVGVDPTEEEGA